jgi:hypothetical protein
VRAFVRLAEKLERSYLVMILQKELKRTRAYMCFSMIWDPLETSLKVIVLAKTSSSQKDKSSRTELRTPFALVDTIVVSHVSH